MRGLRPDFLPVFDICDICDIFCIQETWCAIQDVVCGIVESTTDCNNDYLVTCHPPGGVAIFWCMHLDQNIKRIFFFFSDHSFIVDNFCMHQLNSNSIL